MNSLNLPERHPRRASDGCASISQYRISTDKDNEDPTAASGIISSASQFKAIQLEHQALQVISTGVTSDIDQIFYFRFPFTASTPANVPSNDSHSTHFYLSCGFGF